MLVRTIHNLSSYLFMFLFSVCLSETAASQHNTKSMPASNGYANRRAISYHNLTNFELADVLRNQGFHVQEFPGERPLVRIGDIAYLPEQVMPELRQARVSGIGTPDLWIIDGVAIVYYFFDTETKLDKEKREIFKKGAEAWTNQTCIQFVQLGDNPCKTKIDHPAVCVGDFGACWSYLGKTESVSSGFPQKLSVTGCAVRSAIHEFGHTLGNVHTQARPDRNSHVFIKWENFNCEYEASGREGAVKARWVQANCAIAKGNIADLPIPYDYMSIMHYASWLFSGIESRPIIVMKDSHYQYIPDYATLAIFWQSHYDLYTVNTVYGCVKTWTSSCAASGKQPPKCKNLSYVTKDCKCKCPRAFTGDTCETKVGSSLFPPLKKVHTVHVNKTQLVDFSKYPMRSDTGESSYAPFKIYQFFNVIVHGHDETQKVTIDLPPLEHMPGSYVDKYVQKIIISGLDDLDCAGGMMLLWGVSSMGSLRRVCASSIVNNEPNGTMFRGKTHHMDWIFFSSLGFVGIQPSVTIELMRFKMQVGFEGSPVKMLKMEKAAPPEDKKPGQSEDKTPNMRAASAAQNAGIGIAIAAIAILILGGAGAGVAWYMRSKAVALAEADTPADTPADGDSNQEASSNTPLGEWSNEDDDGAGLDSDA